MKTSDLRVAELQRDGPQKNIFHMLKTVVRNSNWLLFIIIIIINVLLSDSEVFVVDRKPAKRQSVSIEDSGEKYYLCLC
jgi:hypothetical protein